MELFLAIIFYISLLISLIGFPFGTVASIFLHRRLSNAHLVQTNRCARCAYSRDGLEETAPCPECGTTQDIAIQLLPPCPPPAVLAQALIPIAITIPVLMLSFINPRLGLVGLVILVVSLPYATLIHNIKSFRLMPAREQRVFYRWTVFPPAITVAIQFILFILSGQSDAGVFLAACVVAAIFYAGLYGFCTLVMTPFIIAMAKRRKPIAPSA